ncbi:MAG: Vitamin B12 transporter BtuB [Gammaproteobacteria bacterium]|nr:Vitamin B12 transporter BtuB [Gammaproteobacteria bacterium]
MRRRYVLPLTTLCIATAPSAQENAGQLPSITVTAMPLTPFQLLPEWTPLSETNTASLLRRIPGANVNFNGTLAGIAQYRGLFGSRVNVLVDGMAIGNACSNNMDAPLHYLPRTTLANIEVFRGIAPVSSGIETIGGTVVADTVTPAFGESDEAELHGNISLGGQSVDEGYAASGLLSAANQRHRLYAGASRERGGDRSFGDGTIHPSEYNRTAAEVGYGLKLGAHELSADYRRNDTGKTGTPALPMDDIYSDANIGRLGYAGRGAGIDWTAKLYGTGIDHRMSNYEMRQVMPGRSRYTDADAESYGYALTGAAALFGGRMTAGVDGHLAENTSTVYSPLAPMFYMDGFNDAERDRYGFFAEWNALFAQRWSAQLGARYNRVAMDSSVVDSSMAAAPGGLRILRDRFNAADRDQADDNVDLVAKLGYDVTEQLALEVGFGRKTRSPSYQERYLWSPMEATAGLADGNLYVGEVGLDPEVAYQLELGVEWATARYYFSPRAFYHYVTDYIQGTPATDPVVIVVATANGDPTPLQFSNVDARLYGVDAAFGVSLTERWAVDGILSYARGERVDIDDNLFRIAPLNAVVDVSYRRERWSAVVEGVIYAAQEEVSITNGEEESPGYALLNLYGQYTFPKQGLTFSAGVENVLGKTYRPHLNGINRVLNSDVAIGERIPADGINGFVQARFTW